MSFYYLSFVNRSLPEGEQFVGATIVEASDDVEAFSQAWARNLIPSGCEIALLRLWTQTPPQIEIISADQLPNEALPLINKFVPREAIIAQGHRPLGLDNEDYSVICDRHTGLIE